MVFKELMKLILLFLHNIPFSNLYFIFNNVLKLHFDISTSYINFSIVLQNYNGIYFIVNYIYAEIHTPDESKHPNTRKIIYKIS